MANDESEQLYRQDAKDAKKRLKRPRYAAAPIAGHQQFSASGFCQEFLAVLAAWRFRFERNRLASLAPWRFKKKP